MATNLRADAAAPAPDDEPAHLADYRPVVLHPSAPRRPDRRAATHVDSVTLV
jgi:hypothetical protein